jgi:hypothetical protein
MLGTNSAHLKRVQLQQAHAALHKQMVECVGGCQEGLVARPQNHADRAQLSSLAVGLAHVGQHLSGTGAIAIGESFGRRTIFSANARVHFSNNCH